MKSPVKVIFLMVFWISGSLYGTGFATLKWAGGARAGGMGLAYTALADDGSASFWNPAGLSRLKGGDGVLSIHRWFSDVQSEFLAAGWGRGRHGLGAHILYTHVGDLELRETATSEPLALFSAYEMILGLSYSYRIFSSLSLGITVKALYEKIEVDDVWGVAGDIGLIWSSGTRGPRLGWVLQNVGRTGRFNRERIELPLLSRLGVAWPFQISRWEWILSLEGVMDKEASYHLHAGLEASWEYGFILRCGYQSGYETRNISAGLGFKWSRYRIDYNYTPTRWGLGDSHQVGLGFTW